MDSGQLTVKKISFETFFTIWQQTRNTWPWACPFTLPFWLETVHRHLGAPGVPHILAVYGPNGPVGVMPLALDGDTARFLGDPDVCDYQDLIGAPDAAPLILAVVLAHLVKQGVRRLDWQTLRPDALVLAALRQHAPHLTSLTIEPDDVTYEIDLAENWEGYLQQLSGKQRHEVRRKVRRLENEGRFDYRLVDGKRPLDGTVDAFVALFRRNRQDKAAFMSGAMADYFRALIQRLAENGLLRLYMLDVHDHPAASVLCFDHAGVRYLYNSGYDADYDHLSVGILSKVFSIRSAIEMGCHRFDFLKGAETYKKRTGGGELALYRCRAHL
ncbi:MAG: GNAT family N-acetyltransferase [Desulfatitalea sp.]|nr:GNAT family N-acetyltransferase [Desulfatitalea sp.]